LTMTTGELSTTVDWTVLDIDGVTEIARSAAIRVATQYKHTAECDDLYQEALIRLAEDAHVVREYIADLGKGLGMLHHRLWCDLVDMVKTDANRRTRHVSYEQVRAEALA
jgi:hypothetical protein